MPRLFISHSSLDNVTALAFQNWLRSNGWGQDDIFLDLHGIGAGERWRETLRKANASCEAVIFLASAASLESVECQKELELAEALGKEVICVLLHDLTPGDPRLARYSERQFVNLSAFPQDHIEALSWTGQEHRVGFNPEALAKIKGRLENLGIAPDSFAWPRKGALNPEPYPGLAAFGEEDAGIFFGRDADILAALTELRLVRRRRSPRLVVVEAASGAGKSSFLRAGLWPRLKRDSEFAPLAILRPAQGVLSGPEGLGQGLSAWFARHGQQRAAGSLCAPLLGADETTAQRTFAALLEEAVVPATATRRVMTPEAPPPAPLLAIDQGEELFAAGDDAESRRFLALLASVLASPPSGLDPYILITIRADSVDALLSRTAALGIETPRAHYLPPLSPAAYREVILKPAEAYSERVRRLAIDPALADALARDATGADALPLLAFTISRLFADYHAEGKLTFAHYQAMGGIEGSISRALKSAQAKAGAVGSDAHLRRLLLPRLATWDSEADGGKGTTKRLVARRDELLEGPRADLAPLTDALVEARLLSRGRDTLEIAHEALLRRAPISDWLTEDREFLVWRDRVSKARVAYEADARGMLVGRELQIARGWLEGWTDPEDIAPQDRAFITESMAHSTAHRYRAVLTTLFSALIFVSGIFALYRGYQMDLPDLLVIGAMLIVVVPILFQQIMTMLTRE